MTFETTVSTSADQIAIAPGYLIKEWTEGGRRYFHYAMDAPILDFWAYLSARWQVKRDRWNDVAIEIYYDPAHPYNVDRMIDASKKSLEYFTRSFGPYQHRQVRILEFPRYARFASPTRSPSRNRSASSRASRSPRTSTTSSTSPPTRSRTSGGRIRSSAPTVRGRRCCRSRWRSTPRSWSWRRSTAAT